jgi:hypothetical protein
LAGGAGCAACQFSALAKVSVRLQCDGVEAAHGVGVNVLSPVLNLFWSEFTRAHTVKYAFAGVHFFLLLAITIPLPVIGLKAMMSVNTGWR